MEHNMRTMSDKAIDAVSEAIIKAVAREDIESWEIKELAMAAAQVSQADKMASGRELINDSFDPVKDRRLCKREKR